MGDEFYTKSHFLNSGYVIGSHTYGRPRVYDWNDGGNLIIGDYCSIADDVTILLGGNHRTDWFTTYPFNALSVDWPSAAGIVGHPYSKGDVVIGNDVWIGNGATILSGVNIGDGAVIAARALITKNVKPYTIVGGNPAKIIKSRFNEDVVMRLLDLRWWDWPEDKINRNIKILMSNNIEALNKIR